MQFHKAAFAAAALSLGVLAAPAAKADVIYSFNQVGPNQGPGTVNINGQIVVSDAAAANGFSVSLRNNSGSSYQASLADLISLLVVGGNRNNVTGGFGFVTLEDFTYQRPFAMANSYQASFNLSGGAGSGLNGQMNFLNTESQFRLTFSGSSFTGIFGADYSLCGGLQCSFSGTITTAVPEPASLALFGAGLLGLAAVRRKRAA